MYMQKKTLQTTIMSWGYTNYLSPYKTNSKACTKAQMGLNRSGYLVLSLKTKFDVNSCGFVTFFVLDNLKCTGVTQNHEIKIL